MSGWDHDFQDIIHNVIDIINVIDIQRKVFTLHLLNFSGDSVNQILGNILLSSNRKSMVSSIKSLVLAEQLHKVQYK